MMRNEIQTAYQTAAPDEAAAVRIFERVQNEAEARDTARKARPVLRRIAAVAAVIAALALLATGGWAAYQRWFLPEPEPYTPPENGGFYLEHERNEYTTPVPPDPESASPDGGTAPVNISVSAADPEPLSDAFLMRRALEILSDAGMEGPTPESMTVVRQKHLYWDREEAVVSCTYNGLQTSVKFDAETGVFLGMSGIDWVLDDACACRTQAEADALALRYYESLPVQQGYVMQGCEKYDEQFWSYDFCREVLPGIFSSYECVRISINPVSGKLTGTTVFYVPLLDDHEPGEPSLTQPEAEAAALACSALDLERDGYRLQSAEIRVCLPNWYFTADSPFFKASNVTRLCWYLVYELPNSEYPDRICVMVDLYTGEILGGDAVR